MKVTVLVGVGEEATTVALSGELDLATAAGVEARIDALAGEGHHRILVDLHDLTFCDSTGLNALVRGSNRCRTAGGWLRVVRPRDQVAQVLRIAGLFDYLSAGPPTASAEGPAPVDPAGR